MVKENEAVRPRGTDSVRVIQIIVTKSLVGIGVEDDPCRELTQYWSLEGKKIAEYDPYLSGEIESASSKVSSDST